MTSKTWRALTLTQPWCGLVASGIKLVENRSRSMIRRDDFGEKLGPDQVRWFFGPVGYVLRDVRALATPVPCRGWQGFWTLPAEVAARVEEQLQ